MRQGVFKGQSPLGEGVAALRQAQGPLSLGLAMGARGKPPPLIKKNPPQGRIRNLKANLAFTA